MRCFNSESAYNAVEKQWIEFFYIDGRPVPSEEYFDELEKETEIENKKLQEVSDCEDCEDCDCEDCCGCCEYEPTIEDLVDVYTEIIQSVAPCENCIKQVLYDLVSDILKAVDED